MNCYKCGDKPKKGCGAFPKAVIEIDNPEKIVLLRKVLVPASMGDESTFPPTIGKYHNVLLEYEASGGIYLYSSDGIPTKLSSDVTELQAQLNALRVRIGEEEVARADADTALSNRITSLDDSLATVARTGSYNDLSNKPTIGNGTLTIKKNGAVAGTFTANATTNKEIDISVPTRTSDLANDGSDGTSTYVEADELSTVATSGSYNDLTNKPTIGNATLTIKRNGTDAGTFTANATTNKSINIAVPTKTSDLTNDGSDGASTYVEADELSTVATTGSYNDLTNKPTIPTVNNATLTIQKNGTDVQTFTANSSTNKTANITVPTAVSELTNDAGYATTTQLNNGLATKQDTLTAGNNIQINGNTISATDTTYTAGNAIDITNGEISADIYPADFFTAGSTIENCGSDEDIDGTISAPLKSIEIKGDTFQQTYTGKNLLNLTNSSHYGVSGIVNADGTVSISGTATTTVGAGVFVSEQTLSAGTYTMTISKTLPFLINLSMESGVSFRIPAGSTSATTTLPRDYTNQGGVFMAMTAGTTYNETFNLQVVAGSTPDYDFEPYVGGIASPNPDYPQDIQVVTGEQTVTITGKNLFPTVSQTSSSTGITIARNSDGTYNISGTATSEFNAISWVEDLSAFADGQTYTLSVSEQVGDLLVLVDMYNGSTWLRSFPRPSGTTLSQTAALDLTNATKIKFSLRVQSGKTVDLTNLAVQFEKGTATDYEPYRGQSYEINLGKNIWSSSMEVGGISANGTSLSNDKRVRSATKVVVRPGATYTLSAIPRDSGKVINVAIQGWTSDGTFLSQITGADWQTLPLTFTTPANCYKVTLNGRYSDDTVFGTVGESTDAFQNIQLEAGANATEYAQYFPPVELCKIGDHQDYIYKSGDDWYVHKETWSYTFDGSSDEQWVRSGQSTPTNFVAGMANLQDFAMIGGDADSGYCNYFDFATSLGDGKVILSGYQSGGYRFLLYRFPSDSTVTDLTSFTTWLGNHHLKMVLVLSTPADILIENPILVAELNALAEAKSYNDQTNIVITAAGDNLPATLCVEAYRKSLSGVIEAIDNACTCGKKATHLVLSNPTTATWSGTGSIAIPYSDGSAVSMGTFVSTDVVFTKDDGTTMTVGDLYTALTNGKSFEIDLPFGEINSACARDSAAIVATVENAKLDGSSKQTLDQTSQGNLSEMYTSSVPVAVHLSTPWGGMLLDERFGVEHLTIDDGGTVTSSYRFVVDTYETFQPPR